jgi:hypothetical protein
MYVIYIQCLNILGGSALCILAVALKYTKPMALPWEKTGLKIAYLVLVKLKK